MNRAGQGTNLLAESPGTQYGRWTVIKYAGQSPNGHKRMLECECKCGKKRVVAKGNLCNGTSRSCGCLHRELTSRCFRKRVPVDAAKHDHYQRYKRAAETRNLPFSIGKEEFSIVASRNCWYCGSAPIEHNRNKGGTGYYVNGVDRVDNSDGYVHGNVVPCCYSCNRAKMDMPVDAFIAMCVSVSELHGGEWEGVEYG